MSPLTEFLEDTGKRWKDSAPDRSVALADWKSAVERLLVQIEDWVRKADREGLLTLERTEVDRVEEPLGRYRIAAMTIWFGARWVHVVPLGWGVHDLLIPEPGKPEHRASGCIAITDRPSIDSRSASYLLLRLAAPSGDRWFISPPSPANQELTREAFERILVGLLT